MEQAGATSSTSRNSCEQYFNTLKRKGIFIPEDIWQLSELPPNERVVLAEVASFEKNNLPCFASNEHFGEMLHVSENTARGYVYNLIKAGFLVREGDRYNRRLRRLAQTSAQISADECVDSRKRVRKSAQTSAQISSHTITTTKSSTKSSTNKAKPIEIVLPFQTKEFEAAWNEWKAYKKTDHRFKFKSTQTEQRALITLQNESANQSEAISTIHRAITNGWKGLVFNPSKGVGTHAPRARNIETSDNRKKLEELARTGRIDSNRGAML